MALLLTEPVSAQGAGSSVGSRKRTLPQRFYTI